MRKKYDLVFSLGAVCGCSQCLRAMNLQFTSWPLDWAGGSSIVNNARLIAADFADWFKREDLELVYIRRTNHYNWVMRNRKTRLVYAHDFPFQQSVDEAFPAVAEKYARRVNRFLKVLASAKKVLAVYAETPLKPRPSDADVLEARRTLEERFPGVEIDLVCFGQDDACKTASVRALDEQTTSVSVDYRTYEHGRLSHVFSFPPVCDYLGSHVVVDDPRTEDEKRRYAEEAARRSASEWGSGTVSRFVNRKLYKLYRHIENMLIDRGIIPPDQLAKVRGQG